MALKEEIPHASACYGASGLLSRVYLSLIPSSVWIWLPISISTEVFGTEEPYLVADESAKSLDFGAPKCTNGEKFRFVFFAYFAARIFCDKINPICRRTSVSPAQNG
jgi:hypothetical protein